MSRMSVQKIEFTDANFEDETREGLSVVCFGDPNDHVSRQQLIIVDKAAEEIDDEVKVGSCVIVQCSSLAQRFRIKSIPTVLVFKDGQEVERLVGFRHEFTLVKHLRKDVAADS